MSKDLVVKHNDFIEAGYNLNPIQVRILAKLASMIRIDDEDFKLYEFQAKDLLKELKIGEENYTVLRSAIDGFFGKPINIIKVKSNLVLNLLSSAEYFPDGRIELEYSPKMKPMLLRLKENFTKYDAETFMSLRSKYGQRLYELCKQYEAVGKREIEIEFLRKIFYLQDKYKKYGDFKKRIIEPAVQEINDKTDIKVSYKEYKHGKRVHSLCFKIKGQYKLKMKSYKKLELAEETAGFKTAPIKTLKEILAKERSDGPGLLDDLDISLTKGLLRITATDKVLIDRLGDMKNTIEKVAMAHGYETVFDLV